MAEATRIEVTEILDPDQINVIRITNPFNPREFVRDTFAFNNQSLAAYFPLGTVDTVVSLNGQIVPRERFAVTYPSRGDSLVVCPVPAGGGDGDKGILGMIAMIAVSIFAPMVAGALASTLGVTTSLGMAMLTAGVTMAGSMLVQTLFAPSKKTDTNSQATTNSYGIDGAKNTAVEGIPVPVCYGRFRMAGNILALHVENVDDSQVLYMLLNAGEGPIASITDVQVNGNPITEYSAVESMVRLGDGTQSVIPWFNDNIIPHNVNVKLSQEWANYTTNGPVDRVRIDLVAPNGLFSIDKSSGNTNEVAVPLEIQVRREGESSWRSIANTVQVGWRNVVAVYKYDPAQGYTDSSGQFWVWDPDAELGEGAYVPINDQQVTWYYATGGWRDRDARVWGGWDPQGESGPSGQSTGQVVSDNDLDYIRNNFAPGSTSGQVPVFGSDTEIRAAKRSAVRRSFDTGGLSSGVYDVRVRRTTAHDTADNVVDEVWLSDVNEIIMQPMSYPFTALLGLKIKLGEQINGMPEVTFMNGGKVIQAYGSPNVGAVEQWYGAASFNPAWVVWDILTNRRYGAGMPTSRLDFYAFRRWAQYCEQQNMAWNGPIDQEMNAWDASQYVLRVGHAQLVNIGTRWTVVVERPMAPTMMFSVANMVQGSYKETWLPMADRANEVDVTFFDKEDRYKQRTIKIYDPAALVAGQKQRNSAVTLFGITEYERAYQEGMFMMNLNRFIQKTVSFRAPMEAIACTVGDIVLVQHDMPDWAQAGRFAPDCTASVMKLDRPVTMEAGKNYKLLTMHDAVLRQSGTITNIAGDTVFLSNLPASSSVKRLVVGTIDLRILEIFQGSVAVENTTGLTVGAAYDAYDTDVIEEISVVNDPGEHDTITLASPLAVAPEHLRQWMFGETVKVKAPFRIKAVSSSGHDYTREIQALQYDEQVYDFTRFASQHVPIHNAQDAVISQVRNLQLYEQTRITTDGMVTEVIAAWQSPLNGTYAGADVYVDSGNGAFVLQGTARHRLSAEFPAVRGQHLRVKVVAYDIWERRATYSGAPEASLDVVGEVGQVDVGDVTGADVIWSGRDCRLTWRFNSVTHSYEFGSEPLEAGADAGARDPHFKDFEVKVWHATDPVNAVPRRVEYVTDNFYIYSFEKNRTDGLSRRLRFEIRMRDIYNNRGASATLVAYNAPPRLTGIAAEPTFESAVIKIHHTNDADYAGVMIFLSDEEFDLAGDILANDKAKFLAYDGPDTSILLNNLMFDRDHFIRVAPYDVFGKTELLPSGTFRFRTTFLDVNAIAEGVIGESKLMPALNARIDLVDGPADLSGSVAQRLLALSDDVDSKITTETQSRIDGDTALGSRVDAIVVQSNDNNALILEERDARISADTALAEQVDTVQSTVNGNTATVQTLSQSVDGLEVQYTVKIDNNGYVAGYGLASTPVNGVPVSEFGIRADKLWMVMPGYPGVYPFTIGAVNGTPRVVMSSAIMGDAAIGTAHIGELVVNTHHLQLGSVSAAYTNSTRGTQIDVNVDVPSGSNSIFIAANGGKEFQLGDETNEHVDRQAEVRIYFDSVLRATGYGSVNAALTGVGAGTHSVMVQRDYAEPDVFTNEMVAVGELMLQAMVMKR